MRRGEVSLKPRTEVTVRRTGIAKLDDRMLTEDETGTILQDNASLARERLSTVGPWEKAQNAGAAELPFCGVGTDKNPGVHHFCPPIIFSLLPITTY